MGTDWMLLVVHNQTSFYNKKVQMNCKIVCRLAKIALCWHKPKFEVFLFPNSIFTRKTTL